MYYLKRLFIFFIFHFLSFPIIAFTLDDVKNRGSLNCGISEIRVGFADIDSDNIWIGFDVDMCRAVAAAIFSDSNQVNFISTTSRSRFPLLASEEIDLLSRMTTWTFSRDVNLGFEFAGINFYDGQGFMYKSELGIETPNDLNGATICIIEGTQMAFNINTFFNKNILTYQSIPVEFDDEAFESFNSGRCDIYSNYITELANKRIAFNKPDDYSIYPEMISKEPLGPVVRHGDDQWRDVVSWCLKVMILAEELNITSKNIDDFLDSDNNEILRLLGMVGAYGDMIELDEKWAYYIIKHVGNYSEVFNKNLGPETRLNLNRGLNRLYIDGGLLYAPPFR